jgi:hypothetical protein
MGKMDFVHTLVFDIEEILKLELLVVASCRHSCSFGDDSVLI